MSIMTDLGSVFYSRAEAKAHACEQGWTLYATTGPLVAHTPSELLVLNTSHSGEWACWWIRPIRVS